MFDLCTDRADIGAISRWQSHEIRHRPADKYIEIAPAGWRRHTKARKLVALLEPRGCRLCPIPAPLDSGPPDTPEVMPEADRLRGTYSPLAKSDTGHSFAGMTIREICRIPRHYRSRVTSSRIGVRDMISYQSLMPAEAGTPGDENGFGCWKRVGPNLPLRSPPLWIPAFAGMTCGGPERRVRE